MIITEDVLNELYKKENIFENLKNGLLEIYGIKGIDGIVRDRRIKFLLHNLDILYDEDLLAMGKYKNE